MEETAISLEAIRACLKEKNSPDSGTEMIEMIDSQEHDLKKIKEDLDDPMNTAIIKPNLESIRKILGGDGTDQQRKVVEENTGLIPKYYKPYKLLESTESGKPVSLYKCDFCQQVYRGHNSIVYHCRRHIGDYPYRCEDCGFVEVCKSGLSSHMNRTGHGNCRKIDAQPSPGQNGNGSNLTSQPITNPKKPKNAVNFERKTVVGRGKRVNLDNTNDSFGEFSPTKKAKTEVGKMEFSENFWPQRNNNSAKSAKPFEYFKNLSTEDLNSWCIYGGNDSTLLYKNFQTNSTRKESRERVSTRKPEHCYSPDPTMNDSDDSIGALKTAAKNASPPCEEAKHWKFCKKCQTAWYKSEKVFYGHGCFNLSVR